MAVIFDWSPSGAQDAVVTGSATGITRVGSSGTVLYDQSFPLQPPSSARVLVSQFGGVRADFAAQANAGISVEFTVPSLPTADGVWEYLLSLNNGGQHIMDMGVDSAGHVKFRDGLTAQVTSTTFVLLARMHVRAFIHCQPGSATGHQVQLFCNQNVYGSTPDYDSGTFSATHQTGAGPTVTTVSNVQAGQVPSGTLTVDMLVGRIRVTDSGGDPSSGYNGAPDAPVVTATGSDGAVTLSWAVAAGQTGARVWRSSAMAGPYAQTTAQPGAGAGSFTDSAVTNGVTYYYDVRLQNATGWSPRSKRTPGTPGVASSGPAGSGTSSTGASRLYAVADVSTAGCSVTGGDGLTFWSAIDDATASDADYIEVAAGSAYIGQFGPPPTPPASGTTVTFSYRIPAGSTAPVVVSAMLGTTVLASDIQRDSPGSYSFTLTDAQRAQITSANISSLALSVAAVASAVADAAA